MLRLISSLIVASGCVGASPSPPPADAVPASAPAVSSTVLVSWAGQDVISDNPEDSRVPRTLTGPMKPCPNVVGDDVVKVMIEVVIGTGSAYVGDATVDCALGQTTIPVPAGSGTFRLDVVTSLDYVWLAAYSPITTTSGQTTATGVVNLNTELPTSGGGGGGDGDGDGDGGW